MHVTKGLVYVSKGLVCMLVRAWCRDLFVCRNVFFYFLLSWKIRQRALTHTKSYYLKQIFHVHIINEFFFVENMTQLSLDCHVKLVKCLFDHLKYFMLYYGIGCFSAYCFTMFSA